ncbi:MAG: SDR family oxidoreductase [Rhodobacteraceae bacterium]|nr:SDR family oxidoreductase [Paracoccaceae bacterium]
MTTVPRTAIVTGAARGIGRAIATRLAQDGLPVTLADLESGRAALAEAADAIAAAGGACRTAFVDVSDQAAVEALVADHVAALGGLDVMVANAGVTLIARFMDTTPEILNRSLDVNFKGVFHCYMAAARQMIAQGRGGRLIAACSISGHRGGDWVAAYVASKFAVRGLNQCVALELAPHGITANVYSPGMVDTPMYQEIDRMVTEREGRPRGSQIRKMEATIPLGRFALPGDIADVVSFLASEQSRYITGQSLIVDGGVCMN